MDFKFLTNNEVKFPIPYPPISEEDIAHALSVGREHYLNGGEIEINPYLTPELIEAFEQGWELEEDYEILRRAQQRANDGF
jgi:hypothetical protein